MGSVVFWTIVRTAIFIPVMWILFEYIDYKIWFSLALISIYGIIVHPAIIQYRLFLEENKSIIHNTLCSSCKYFDETAVICLKYDIHPTMEDLPCNGLDWEPSEKKGNEQEV